MMEDNDFQKKKIRLLVLVFYTLTLSRLTYEDFVLQLYPKYIKSLS